MSKKSLGIIGLVLVVVLVFFIWVPTQYVVPVLMYHSVASSYEEPLNNVRPESFAKQMAFLKSNGYRVLSSSELVAGIKTGKRFPFKSVVITFDDGLDNNYLIAYPILKSHSFSATMFIPSDEVGRKGRVNWDQLKELASNGITIGSHTRTETYVPDADGKRLVSEIEGSKLVLEKKLGCRVDFIAYPVGGFTVKAKEIVRQSGYLAAFTTNRGYSKKNDDLFALRRIRIKDTDSGFVLMAKLSGYYNFFRSVRSPH